jgi:hypothetical protein
MIKPNFSPHDKEIYRLVDVSSITVTLFKNLPEAWLWRLMALNFRQHM